MDKDKKAEVEQRCIKELKDMSRIVNSKIQEAQSMGEIQAQIEAYQMYCNIKKMELV